MIVGSLNLNLLKMGPTGQNKVCSAVAFIGEEGKKYSGSSQLFKITDIFNKCFQDSCNPEIMMGSESHLPSTTGKQQSLGKQREKKVWKTCFLSSLFFSRLSCIITWQNHIKLQR